MHYNINRMRTSVILLTLYINNCGTFSSYINKGKINMTLKLDTTSFYHYYAIILLHLSICPLSTYKLAEVSLRKVHIFPLM